VGWFVVATSVVLALVVAGTVGLIVADGPAANGGDDPVGFVSIASASAAHDV